MPAHLSSNANHSPPATIEPHAPERQPCSPQVIVVPAAGNRQTVWWVIAVLLAIIATALVDRWDSALFSKHVLAQQASAQAGLPPVGARGIYAFTGQLGAKEYGLFMMDVDSGTVWCYQMGRSREGDFQLQLVAARSWIFDRFLEEFNVAKPTPNEVQMMVRTQRGRVSETTPLPVGVGPDSAVIDADTQPSASPFAPALPKEDSPR